MPAGQPNAKPDRAELEAAIDALLSEIDTTCTRFEQPQAASEDEDLAEDSKAAAVATNASPPPPLPSSSGEPASGGPTVGVEARQAIEDAESAAEDLLEAAADQLIESLETEVASTRGEPAAELDTAPVAAPAWRADPALSPAEQVLAESLDDLLDQTQSPAAETTEPAPESESESEVESERVAATPDPVTALPDAFAGLDAAFDEMMEGSFESSSGEAVDTAGVDTRPDPALMLDRTVGTTAISGAATDVAADVESESGVVVQEPIRTHASAPVKPPAASVDGVFPSRVLTWARVRAASRVAPVGSRVLLVLSKPLEGKPPGVRDSIGWVAIWTLFLGLCVWAFVVLRPATMPPNDGQGTRVVTAETPTE